MITLSRVFQSRIKYRPTAISEVNHKDRRDSGWREKEGKNRLPRGLIELSEIVRLMQRRERGQKVTDDEAAAGAPTDIFGFL